MDERITYEENAIVSVIIPTYNRINDLIECLNSIIKQTITPKEVIFIDDSDDDQVRDFVQDRFHEFACKGIDLRYIKNSREKSSAIARNIGIGLAKGDFLLFLDSDIILEDCYIQEIIRIYKEFPNALGVTGYITNINYFKYYNKMARIFYLSFLEPNRCRVMPSTEITYPFGLDQIINPDAMSGSNMSFKKSILNEIKFDEKLLRYSYKEDEDISYYISKLYQKSLFMTPHAKVLHCISDSGRMPQKLDIYMKQIYALYFFYKNINQTHINKIIFIWSRFGYIVFYIMGVLFRPRKSSYLKLKYLIEAYTLCFKRKKDIECGNIEFFNSMLRRKMI